MKKRLLYFLIFALLPVLCACGEEEITETSKYSIFYLNSDFTGLYEAGFDTETTSTKGIIEEFVAALNGGPTAVNAKKLADTDNFITGYSLESGGVLYLYFDSTYQQLNVTREALVRAAIVKTFCQLDNVRFVGFYVDDQPLMKSVDTPRGLMSADDFAYSFGDTAASGEKTTVTVYFAKEDGSGLEGVRLNVDCIDGKSTEYLVLEQLIAGPSEALEGLTGTVNNATTINKVTTRDGICYVNLGENVLTIPDGITEELCVYSIVNSLTEITGVTKVQLSIESQTGSTFRTVDISGSLERRLELVSQ